MIESESGAETAPGFDRQRMVKEAFRHLKERRTTRAEAALEWFYTEGQCLFERSAAGGQLRGLMMASAALVDCPVCCSVERRMFCGSEAKTFDEAMERGSLHLIDRERLRRGILIPGYLPSGQVCTKCSGSGQVEVSISHNPDCMVTARPTGHEVREHGYQVDDVLITRYAQCTRWLQHVGAMHSDTLEAYYGPDACRCAMVHPWGMHLAVMPQSEAGKELLKRTRRDHQVSLRPVERIRVQAIIQTQSPTPWRGELLERGYSQASAMLKDALEAFAGLMA